MRLYVSLLHLLGATVLVGCTNFTAAPASSDAGLDAPGYDVVLPDGSVVLPEGGLVVGAPCETESAFACIVPGGTTRVYCDPGSKTWETAAACTQGKVCAASSGECAPPAAECQSRLPGAVFCKAASDKLLVTCSADLTVATERACEGETPICRLGACVECAEGAEECHALAAGGQGARKCVAGKWVETPCAGETAACMDGHCTQCSTGQTQCTDNDTASMACGPAGSWDGTKTACPNGCANGRCRSCVPGTLRCGGKDVETCDASGAWGTGVACPLGQECDQGQCRSKCIDGNKKCDGKDSYRCTGGSWVKDKTCTGECLQSNGECVDCVPGATQCVSASEQRECSPSGTWRQSACPYVCTGNKCGGSCVPGSRTCSGLTPKSCGADGTWTEGAACPYACDKTQGACTGECNTGDKVCDGNTYKTCESNRWRTESCQFACLTSGCAACAAGSARCYGNVAETCVAGAWVSLQICTQCANGSCVVATQCTEGQTRCEDGRTSVCQGGAWVQGSSCPTAACVVNGSSAYSKLYSGLCESTTSCSSKVVSDVECTGYSTCEADTKVTFSGICLATGVCDWSTGVREDCKVARPCQQNGEYCTMMRGSCTYTTTGAASCQQVKFDEKKGQCSSDGQTCSTTANL